MSPAYGNQRRGPRPPAGGPRSSPGTGRIRAFWIALLFVAATARADVLDDFSDVSDWIAAPSDGVELRISADHGAMRLDYDFHGGAGYAIARKPVRMQLPADYELTFLLRGETPSNTLEIKFLDATGENVWWQNRRDFRFPRDWTRQRIKKRHLEFAWGPSGGKPLTEISAIEIVITASTGGKGTVWVDDLTFVERPPRPATYPAPVRTTSAQSVVLDLAAPRELGGLTLHWTKHAPDYEVELSDDAKTWETALRVTGSNGGRDPLFMPDSDARYVRIRAATPFTLGAIDLEPLEFSASRNAFFARIAGVARAGLYPRYFGNEQSYWTVVGKPEEERELLLSEDGAIEVDRASFSVEPFLFSDGKLITWRDVERAHSLADGYLPIPSVEWKGRLTVTAYPTHARYRVTNPANEPRTVTLFLAIRPFQVNPPWQFLNVPGGTSEIHEIAFDGSVVRVEGKSVATVTKADGFGATAFAAGDITEWLERGALPDAKSVMDAFGAASAALRYDLVVEPNGHRDVTIAFAEPQPDAERAWRERLGRFDLQIAGEEGALVARVVKSNLAYILINQDGPAIQPGSRSYDRSWIRDGSLTSAALLRLGYHEPVKAFIEWFAPHQFPTGKVPCCVDTRGADPVPENDSHGQLIYLIAEYYRHTHDHALVERMWPHIEKAVAYIDSLRKQRMTPEYQTPAKRAFYGLVPESISHEGYSAKPMHSYWDDFFVLRGLRDAAFLAKVLGKTTQYAAMEQEFRRDLMASIAATRKMHGIEYIPGSVELGDFDATSTTIALAPGDELASLDRKALEATFERYWRDAISPRDYTPYEARSIGTFIRLGQRDRAHGLLRFLLEDLRPREWNQWSEAVFAEPRTPKFIGDMPHTWVGSDFIRSVLDMFAYEEGDTIIVAAGVPDEWTRGEGVVLRGLRTHFGTMNVTIRGEKVEITGGAKPPGGFRIRR